jgi:hypothetical protein
MKAVVDWKMAWLATALVGLVAAGAVGVLAADEPAVQAAPQGALPVRGLHVSIWGGSDIDAAEQFIREVLPREGVNVLVLSLGYNYRFTSYPEVGSADAPGPQDVRRLLVACRESGIKLIPEINCFGHQSWGAPSGRLLRAFPEFDETPQIPQDAGRREIYCRSYCPLHPRVHEVLFALMDEMANDFEATDFHVGMDEVFLLGDDSCPRCKGKDPAGLFAGEVTKLHDHLAESGRTMWMWGDRLLDAQGTGLGRWEAAANGTHPAIDSIPKDIIICDWHYDRAPRTPEFFVEKGFRVVACPWRKSDVALEQLKLMRELRAKDERALGMLQTTWCGLDRFIQAYNGDESNQSAFEAAQCFKALFAAMREAGDI